MAHGWRRSTAAMALGLLVCVPGIPVARACCPAWKGSRPVRIADQKILVIWDPETRTEHFIRSAGFRAGTTGGAPPGDDTAADAAEKAFGFLVPSPSQPEVAEADDGVFAALDDLIRPRIEEVERWRADPTPLVLMPFLLRAPATTSRAVPPMADVRVLERKRVGQYDVAVLKADDATALTDWLATNGFESRPALREWAEPYVAKGWIITAFRYVADASRIETGGVRMSFQTEIPMFAYRVPTDNLAAEGQASVLRAFVVVPGRASGTLGEGESARSWSAAQCRYSRPLPAESFAALFSGVLPTDAAAPRQGAWLTAFDDATWPSGTDDLRFTHEVNAAEYQEVVRTFRDRSIPIPLDVIGLSLVAAGWGLRRQFV